MVVTLKAHYFRIIWFSLIVIYWDITIDLRTPSILRHETLVGLNRNWNPDFSLTLVLQLAQKSFIFINKGMRLSCSNMCSGMWIKSNFRGGRWEGEEMMLMRSTVQNHKCSCKEKSVLYKLINHTWRCSYLLGSRALWANSSSVGPVWVCGSTSPSWKDAWEAACWEISKHILKLWRELCI